MKVTADKKYLKKVVDKADYARLNYEMAREKGEKSPAAKSDWKTASHYIIYLGAKALEKDEEFCEELKKTAKELIDEGTTLELQLTFLHQLVEIGRRTGCDSEGNSEAEELEKNFDAFFDRVPIDRIRKRKKEFVEFMRTRLSKDSEENSANLMYA